MIVLAAGKLKAEVWRLLALERIYGYGGAEKGGLG